MPDPIDTIAAFLTARNEAYSAGHDISLPTQAMKHTLLAMSVLVEDRERNLARREDADAEDARVNDLWGMAPIRRKTWQGPLTLAEAQAREELARVGAL